jgi:hypothetical protein
VVSTADPHRHAANGKAGAAQEPPGTTDQSEPEQSEHTVTSLKSSQHQGQNNNDNQDERQLPDAANPAGD